MPAIRCFRYLSVLCAVLLTGVACSSEKAEVQIGEAIRQHLAKRTDLSKMDIELDGVDYTDDTATARVTIKAREDENARMQWVYQLRKVGSEWQVQPSDESAGHAAGGGAAPPSGLPPGHPPAGGTQPQGGAQMPPGHPPIGGQPQQQPKLPQGHPPVSQ